ncbi:TetR/AcrR family transcriptional regulator [Microbacterium sp. SORGH_AS_0862]|uniref:TetR/AcrR family transcriptional regulator n=1 Tax=Microbacterium sp. SORGH_AS_0862 TaxID=3041789 RepID=UPI00278E437A|nr:TetR/AcrR family transcriptional regulator [Microbacterium sp. SORGH_AS_0862]MDQ1203862.1 AcrR family transcriptional regulator [Microbacterium sp. SORGH_AS_0862]
MSPYAYDENGRRIVAPSKGELREKQILDEAEKQLIDIGHEAMTVESIATAAGLTRGALYFYFRSKNDVIAALVQRITVELTSAIATRRAASPTSAHGGLLSAIDLTRDLWSRHGAVMRTAIELSPSVPFIDHLWSSARAETIRSLTEITESAAIEASASERASVVSALVAMTERVFYEAIRSNSDLDAAAEVVTMIWNRALPLPHQTA